MEQCIQQLRDITQGDSRDAKVLDGSCGLGTVQSIVGDLDGTERIVLNPGWTDHGRERPRTTRFTGRRGTSRDPAPNVDEAAENLGLS